MSKLRTALGLPAEVPAKAPASVVERLDNALTDGAMLFLEAGGVIRLDDLAALDADELSALAYAGRMIQLRSDINTGCASHGSLEAGELAASLDGGALYAKAKCADMWARLDERRAMEALTRA